MAGVHAQTQGVWQIISPMPDRAHLFAATFLSDSFAVAVGDVGTIRWTADTGSTWNNTSSGIEAPLRGITAFGSTTCIAVGDRGTMIRSGDMGKTWQNLVSNTGEDIRGIASINGTNGLAVGSRGLILRTQDRGITWRHVESSTSSDLLAVDFIDSMRAMAVGEGGIMLQTNNGGESWNRMPSLTQKTLRSIAIADSQTWYIAGDSGAIFTTLSGGSEWWGVLSNLNDGFFFRDIHFLTADTGVAVGLRHYGLNREETSVLTTDGGISWRFDDGGFRRATWGIAARKNYGLIVGHIGTIERFSRHTGTPRHTSITVAYGGSMGFLNIHCINANNCTAIGNIETFIYDPSHKNPSLGRGYEVLILRTRNGGMAWEQQQSGIPRERNFPINMRGITGTDSLRWTVAGDSGIIIHTTDGGSTWQQQKSGTRNSLRAVHSVNADTGVTAGIGGVIAYTTNAGATWNTINNLPSELFRDIYAPAAGKLLTLAGTKRIYQSTSPYTAWTQVPGEFVGHISDIDFLDSLYGVAVGQHKTPENNGQNVNDYICITTDGGLTWNALLNREIGPVPAGLIDVSFADRARGITTGNAAKILHTTDSGRSWRQEIPPISGLDQVIAVAFPAPSHAISVTWQGTLLRYDKRNEIPVVLPPYPSRINCGSEHHELPVKIHWSSSAGATRYHLQISTRFQSGFDESAIVLEQMDISDTFFVATTLATHQEYYWRVRAYNDSTESDWSATCNFATAPTGHAPGEPPAVPVSNLSITGIHPNPAHSTTTIRFRLNSPGRVRLSLHDIQGEEVLSLGEVEMADGPQSFEADLSSLPAGTYHIRLSMKGEVVSQRLTIVR